MRNVVLIQFLSADGVAEAPDTFFFAWDEVIDANDAGDIATQDAVILGRRSYDEWSEFWPTAVAAEFTVEVPSWAPRPVATSSRSRRSSTGWRNMSPPRRRSIGSGPTRP